MGRVVRLPGFTEAMHERVPVLLAKLPDRLPGLKGDLAGDRRARSGTLNRAGRGGPCDHVLTRCFRLAGRE